MGLPDEPGGVYPPSTYLVHLSAAYPGMFCIKSLNTILADNLTAAETDLFNAMTDEAKSVYLSATHSAIKNADPPRGSARFWRRPRL